MVLANHRPEGERGSPGFRAGRSSLFRTRHPVNLRRPSYAGLVVASTGKVSSRQVVQRFRARRIYAVVTPTETLWIGTSTSLPEARLPTLPPSSRGFLPPVPSRSMLRGSFEAVLVPAAVLRR